MVEPEFEAGGNEKMNKKIFEASVLFILLVNVFRTQSITNLPVMVAIAVSFIFFLGLSLKVFSQFAFSAKIRFLSFAMIIILLYSFLLTDVVFDRIAKTNRTLISDAAKVTEVASLALLSGKNPYSIPYHQVFYGPDFLKIPTSTLNNYPYSPFMFLANIPFLAITANLVQFFDLRIILVIMFLLTAGIVAKITSQKLLFLIMFLLNPIFIPKLFFGTSDVLPLFLIFLCFVFLYFQKVTGATIALALATASKLTALPFVPLYFLYIFRLSLKQQGGLVRLARQFAVFTLINLVVYLPFLLWNAKDLLEDVFLYHLELRPIQGFLGLPQLLTSLGLISIESNIPFYLGVFPASFVFLLFAHRIFKKWQDLTAFCVLGVLSFVLFFFFSRVLQTDYLAFLSQILLLGGFLKVKK
jgi:hypothetical protein